MNEHPYFRWRKLNGLEHPKWLEENLQDMNNKVNLMFKLIEGDGDSFAKRAEMYYETRPELMKLVESFSHSYRLLAERYSDLSCKHIPHPPQSNRKLTFEERMYSAEDYMSFSENNKIYYSSEGNPVDRAHQVGISIKVKKVKRHNGEYFPSASEPDFDSYPEENVKESGLQTKVHSKGSELQAKVQKLIENNDHIQIQNIQLKEENDRLKLELSHLKVCQEENRSNENSKNYFTEIQARKKEIAELELKVFDLVTLKQKLGFQCNRFKALYENSTEEIANLWQCIRQLEHEATIAEEEHEILKADNSSQVYHIKKLEDVIEIHRNKAKELQEAIQNLQEENSLLQNQLQNKDITLQNLQDKSQSLQTECQKHLELESAYSSMVKELEDHLLHVQMDNCNLEELMLSKLQTIWKLQESADKMKHENIILQDDITTGIEEINGIENELQGIKMEREILLQIVHDDTQWALELESDINLLCKQLKRIEKDHIKLEAFHQKTVDERNALGELLNRAYWDLARMEEEYSICLTNAQAFPSFMADSENLHGYLNVVRREYEIYKTVVLEETISIQGYKEDIKNAEVLLFKVQGGCKPIREFPDRDESLQIKRQQDDNGISNYEAGKCKRDYVSENGKQQLAIVSEVVYGSANENEKGCLQLQEHQSFTEEKQVTSKSNASLDLINLLLTEENSYLRSQLLNKNDAIQALGKTVTELEMALNNSQLFRIHDLQESVSQLLAEKSDLDDIMLCNESKARGLHETAEKLSRENGFLEGKNKSAFEQIDTLQKELKSAQEEGEKLGELLQAKTKQVSELEKIINEVHENLQKL